MTSKLVDRFKILKKFKTGTVVIETHELSLNRLQVILDIGLTGEQVNLRILENGLTHVVSFYDLTAHYVPATPLAQTLYGIKGRKTY